MEHEIHKTEVKQAIKTARTWSVLARGPARAATMARGTAVLPPQRAGAPSNPRSADATRGRVGCRREHVSPRLLPQRPTTSGSRCPHFSDEDPGTERSGNCLGRTAGLSTSRARTPGHQATALSHPANDENEGQGLGPPWGVPEHQNKAYAPDQRGKPAVRDQPRDFRNQEILY